MSVQTEKAKANPNMWYYINSVVCVVLMVGFRFLPTFGQVTPYGMEVLGIFFGAIYGWLYLAFIFRDAPFGLFSVRYHHRCVC